MGILLSCCIYHSIRHEDYRVSSYSSMSIPYIGSYYKDESKFLCDLVRSTIDFPQSVKDDVIDTIQQTLQEHLNENYKYIDIYYKKIFYFRIIGAPNKLFYRKINIL